MATKIMPISDLRHKTRDVIDTVLHEREAVYITQYGRPVVVVVEYGQYEQLLEQLQDLSDQASLEIAADQPARAYTDYAAEIGLATDVQPEG